VQIVKAALLMTGATLRTILVMFKFGWNVSRMLGDAAAASGKGDGVPQRRPVLAKESAGPHRQARPDQPRARAWCSAPRVCRTS
jgi:cation/acetate symporter